MPEDCAEFAGITSVMAMTSPANTADVRQNVSQIGVPTAQLHASARAGRRRLAIRMMSVSAAFTGSGYADCGGRGRLLGRAQRIVKALSLHVTSGSTRRG